MKDILLSSLVALGALGAARVEARSFTVRVDDGRGADAALVYVDQGQGHEDVLQYGEKLFRVVANSP
jgi:hypothetical protein